MKRSKMLSIIGNLHPFRTMLMTDAEPLINDLLDEVEKEGMLPPSRKVDYKEQHVMRQFMTPSGEFESYHSWESEE